MVAIDDLEIVGVILAGEGVIVAAVLLDDVGEFLGPSFLVPRNIRCSHRCDIAGLADLLVARAHAIENVEGRDRRLVVFQHDDLEPVGQLLVLDGVGDSGVARR